MKKLLITITLLLCFVMISSMLLTSCDKSENNPSTTTTQSTTGDPSPEDNPAPPPSTDVVATGVTLDKTSLSLVKGESSTLTATITPNDTTDKTLTWSSSNESVATVNSGTITAVGSGTTTITVTTSNGKTATCDITVTVPVSGVSLNKTSLSLLKGNSETLTATIVPDDATDKTLTWASSNENIVTVANGKVTAVGAGTATITVTTANGQTATCEVTVNILADSVTLNKTTLSLVKGNSETLIATITPNDTTDKTLTWSTSNAAVVTVENGKVTAVGTGTATITVTTSNGKTATCVVTVNVLASGITLDKTSVQILETETTTLTATVSPSDTTNKTVIWTSSDPTIAFVADGVVTAMSSGTATITATDSEGHTATCTVMVTSIGISFKTLSVNGSTVYGKFSNDTTTFSFIDEISATKYARFEVYSDYDCKNIIKNKTPTLTEGDNTFYILEYANDDVIGLYTVTIRRRPMYTVNFDTVGGTTVEPQRVEEDSFATTPTTVTKIGYTFAGWNFDFNTAITSDTTITAQWTANNNTPYKVEHYTENIDHSYKLEETENLTGISDSTVTPATKNYEGFTAPNTQTVTIYPDGSLVVKYYYTRNSFPIVYRYSVNEDGHTCTITGVELNTHTVADIPEYIDGKKVTSIGNSAFSGCTELIRVIIPNSVTSIGEGAFGQCSAITSITLPNSVTSISDFTFISCSNLESITIPNSVTSIGASAFSGCASLMSITLPNSVTRIDFSAFRSCTGLTSVIIPNSVTYLSFSAFENCTGLKSVTIGNGVSVIDQNIFSGCTNLTSITIPNSIEKIYNDAFYGCTNLTAVFYGGTSTQWDDIQIFDDNDSLTAATVYFYTEKQPTVEGNYWHYVNGVPTIWEIHIHNYSTNLTSPTVTQNGYTTYTCGCGDSYTVSIIPVNFEVTEENRALIGYKGEENENLVIPAVFQENGTWYRVTSIGAYAFRNCEGLISVTIPNSVTVIGKQAFYRCAKLSNVIIPNSVTTIEQAAFRRCDSLVSIFIPSGVTSIGTQVFSSCAELIRITVDPNNNRYHSSDNCLIETEAKTLLAVCKTSVIPTDGSATSIAEFVFDNFIESVIVPNNITSISQNAFTNCTNLITVFYCGTSEQWNAIYNKTLTSITVCFYTETQPTVDGNYWHYVNDVPTIWPHVHRYNSVVTAPTATEDGYTTYTCGCGDSYTEAIIPVGFEVTEENRALIGYKREDNENLVIPAVFQDNGTWYRVTSIGEGAFTYCARLISITIPNSVTSIGNRAFYGCGGLTSVTIGNGVTNIGDSAFYNCYRLTSITIPDSVTIIGQDTFFFCEGLTSITIPHSITSIGDSAFYGCMGLNVYITDVEAWLNISFGDTNAQPNYYGKLHILDENGNKVTEVVIPDSVTSISGAAFRNCTGLTSITIPNSVTSIGASAFSGCTGLTSITIPNSVTSIGGYAFSGCTGLTSITIPNSVTSIGGYAFSGCISLESITLPFIGATKDGTSNTHFGYIFGATTFSDNSSDVPLSLKTVIITGGDSIGDSAFEGCTGITSITIPNSVTTIGYSAFYNCKGLTEVHITDITSWCKISFSNATASPLRYAEKFYLNGKLVTELVIPDGITSIGNYAFANRTGLVSIIIPDSVESIGFQAFYGCTGLTSITIPNSVTSIGSGVFFGCTGLTSVTIGNSVESIGNNAFYGCTNLTTVFYGGTSKQWNTISIEENNDLLTSATVYFYSETQPTVDGNYWHYVDDVPTIWGHTHNYTSVVTAPTATKDGYTTYTCNCGYSYTVSIIPVNFKVTEGNRAMIGYTGANNENLVIPAVFQNNVTWYRVTSIGYSAFYGCKGLTSITIPNSVTSIGGSAFQNCTRLTSITIPNSVTSIDGSAFQNCTGLTSIIIPNSVTSIGNHAFDNCTGLTSITIPNRVTSIGSYAFYNCTGLTSIIIPNSVTSIGSCAFAKCTGLTSITIPNGVTSIGGDAFNDTAYYNNSSNWENGVLYLENYLIDANRFAVSGVYSIKDGTKLIAGSAFHNCTELTSITIPNSVTSIGDHAFSSCWGLISITIPNSVTSIGSCAFAGCHGLTSVTIGNGVTSIGNDAFSDCNGLTSVTIGNGVTSIGEDAFYNCTGLTSINIPDSVTSIGEEAFRGCTGLTSITIGNGITSIGSRAFNDTAYYNDSSNWENGVLYLGNYLINADSSAVSGVYSIKDGTKLIAGSAFKNCTELTSITIPNSVTSIGSYAFSSCWGLISITIPNSVTSIGMGAFINCTGLTSVTIGNGVTSIGYDAFSDCSRLKDVYITDVEAWLNISFGNYSAHPNCYGTLHILDENGNEVTELVIPDSVTIIGGCAFYNCTGLTSVTIGNGVTSIGEDAFYNCTGLTSVTIGNGVTSIGSYAFYNCTGLTSVTIGNGVTSIGSYAFKKCTGLTSVTIGNGVTSIGYDAFSDCSRLKDVYITDVEAWLNISFGSHPNCYGTLHILDENGNEVTELVIPNSVTIIGGAAFYNCTGLTRITIPNSVTSIGNHAFYNCTALTSITIPNSVTSIGNHAFENCTGLTSVTIPNSVTSIGSSAFYNCTGLTSVTIGNGVTSIGENVFYNCTGFTSINFNGTKAQWKAITKASYWDNNTGNYTIYCTDGTITKE